MARRPVSPRLAPRSPSDKSPRPNDPVSRLGRFLQFMSLGLLAAALFLPFSNPIHLPENATLAWNFFPSPVQNAAVLAVHTSIPWIVLSVLCLLTTVIAYRSRRASAMSRAGVIATLAVLLVIGIHVAALGYLQSQSPLKIELRGPAPPGLELSLGPSTGTAPAEFHEQAITRLTLREGTSQQWRLLVAGDALFSMPLILVWLLRLAAKKVAKSNPELLR